MAKYSSPTTKPISPWRASRPILRQNLPSSAKFSGVLDIDGRRVAMDNDRLVLHQHATSFIVAPDALRLWVSGCAAEHAPEHLQRRINPTLLIDRGGSARSTLGTKRTTRSRFRPPWRTFGFLAVAFVRFSAIQRSI
jgi:hypothetical protein